MPTLVGRLIVSPEQNQQQEERGGRQQREKDQRRRQNNNGMFTRRTSCAQIHVNCSLSYLHAAYTKFYGKFTLCLLWIKTRATYFGLASPPIIPGPIVDSVIGLYRSGSTITAFKASGAGKGVLSDEERRHSHGVGSTGF
jgi:hypothetical protein